MNNFLKVNYNPSNKFYKKLYEFINEEFKDDFKGLDVTVRNKKHPVKFVDEITEIGYINYNPDYTEKKVKYLITLMELKHFDIGTNTLKLMSNRCKTYIESLGLEFCPETATIMTLLHELGHVVYVEEFIKCIDDFDLSKFLIFDKTLDSVFDFAFAPWEMNGFVPINMARIIFHSNEAHSEGYVYRNFPRFIEFIRHNKSGRIK
jgi:hypothetical protein